ncbi:MAG: hypothetical protein JWM10_4914, partial [Myxococcaceae bacterium]|nr:hypothetical protein [Myxococcaceae bacterium]
AAGMSAHRAVAAWELDALEHGGGAPPDEVRAWAEREAVGDAAALRRALLWG